MTPVPWIDEGHSGKQWLLREDKKPPKKWWVWEGSTTEALEACASDTGAKIIEDQRTAGLLIPSRLEHVLELAHTGWTDGMALAKIVGGISVGACPWPTEAWYDVYGDEPDVAAYCAGAPESMVQWREERRQGANVGYQRMTSILMAPWYVRPEVMAYLGAVMMSATDYLESSGVRCALETIGIAVDHDQRLVVAGPDPSQDIVARLRERIPAAARVVEVIRITIKDYEHPMAEAATAFWLGHPAVLRGVVFGLAGGAKGLAEELGGHIGNVLPLPVIGGHPSAFPFGGWERGIAGIVFDGDGYAAQSVLTTLMSMLATIAKWLGRDGALQWLSAVHKKTYDASGEFGKWVSVVLDEIEKSKCMVPADGRVTHKEWRELLSGDKSIDIFGTQSIRKIFQAVEALVREYVPEQAWGWQESMIEHAHAC